jgi:hypothetical protein
MSVERRIRCAFSMNSGRGAVASALTWINHFRRTSVLGGARVRVLRVFRIADKISAETNPIAPISGECAAAWPSSGSQGGSGRSAGRQCRGLQHQPGDVTSRERRRSGRRQAWCHDRSNR